MSSRGGDSFRERAPIGSGCFGVGSCFRRQTTSSGDGEADLHLVADPTAAWPDTDVTLLSSLMVHALPEGLLFGNSVRVHTRSLDSLARAKEIPKDLAVVKIDTEGYDLQVIGAWATSSRRSSWPSSGTRPRPWPAPTR